ncbi:MAG: response regulator transcription factor [Myxococcales bacterium]|nr:response regulator transcription factor [Myxococcales bacterium]
MKLSESIDDPSTLRVMLVCEDPLVAAGLTARLESAGPVAQEVAVMGPVSPRIDLSEAARLYAADVMLVDLGAEASAGAEVLGRLEAHEDAGPAGQKRLPWVVLAVNEATAETSLQRGASGALGRVASGPGLRAALHAAYRGVVALSPEFMKRAPRGSGEARAEGGEALTAREREVLAHMAEGLSNKLIAVELGISEHTAKFHVNAVMAKMAATTRTEAVVRAARRGLLML